MISFLNRKWTWAKVCFQSGFLHLPCFPHWQEWRQRAAGMLKTCKVSENHISKAPVKPVFSWTYTWNLPKLPCMSVNELISHSRWDLGFAPFRCHQFLKKRLILHFLHCTWGKSTQKTLTKTWKKTTHYAKLQM